MRVGHPQHKSASRYQEATQDDGGSVEYTDSEDRFVPREGDEDDLWEVIEIVAERGREYRVRWAGVDPRTNKPWPLDWVPKSDCTPDIVKAWKQKKAEKEAKKKGKGKTAQAKSKQTSSAKGKGKAKAEESSDYEDEPESTRKTRTYSRYKSTADRTQEAGPSHVGVPSSPGTVFKIGPPIGVKRRKPNGETTQPSAKRPIVVSDLDDGSQPIPIGKPTKKRRLANVTISASGASFISPQPQSEKGPAKSVEDSPATRSNSTLVNPTHLESDREASPRSGIWEDDPVLEDTAALHNSRDDIIPDSQPNHITHDVSFLPDTYEPPPAYTSHDESRRPRSPGVIANSPSAAGPSTSRAAKTPPPQREPKTTELSEAEPLKVLRPVAQLSPSVFRPYLPQAPQPDSPIESFDSPVKRTRAPRMRTRSQEIWQPTRSTLTDPSQDTDLAMAEEMEVFLDYSGGQRPVSQSPVQARAKQKRRRSQSHSRSPPRVRRRESVPLQQNDSSQLRHSQDTSRLLTLPPTASTQRADIDSQSQIIPLPTSQSSDAATALQQKDDLIKELRERLSQHEDKVTELNATCQTRDGEIAKLREELEILRAEKASLVSAELLEEESRALAQARSEARELEETLANVRAAAQQNSWKVSYEGRIKQLQADLTRWRGLYEILRSKDERTNDELRRRAAEQPELSAKNKTLQAENEDLRLSVARMETDMAALQQEKEAFLSQMQEVKLSRETNEVLAAQKTALETRVNELQETVERMEEESILQQENQTIQNSLLEHNAKILQDEVEALRTDNEKISLRETTLQEDNSRLRDELARAKEEIQTARTELDRTQMKLDNAIQFSNLATFASQEPDAWACIYRSSSGDECHQVFESTLDLRRHFYATHVIVK